MTDRFYELRETTSNVLESISNEVNLKEKTNIEETLRLRLAEIHEITKKWNGSQNPETLALLARAREFDKEAKGFLDKTSGRSFDSFTAQEAQSLLIDIDSITSKLPQLFADLDQHSETIAQQARLDNLTPASALPSSRSRSSRTLEFYDPSRPEPYWANEISKHQSRNAAIQALARQFEATTTWIENNMGSSNDLETIHSNLVRAMLKEDESVRNRSNGDSLTLDDVLSSDELDMLAVIAMMELLDNYSANEINAMTPSELRRALGL